MARMPQFRSIFRRSGTVTIEYAIVLPVLLILVLGTMDTGRLLWTYVTLYRATEAAARCASISAAVATALTCSTYGKTQSYAAAAAWGLSVPASAFSVSHPACGMQVHASYGFGFVFPPRSITLTTTACYPFLPPA